MTSSITTLGALQAHFSQGISGQELVLTPENSVVVKLADFVASLPAGRLALQQPDIQLVADRLTIVASSADAWPVGWGGARALQLTRVRLTFTQPDQFAVDLAIEGTISVAGGAVAVAGALGADHQVTVRLQPGASRSLSLSSLADEISDNKLGPYLPPGVSIFDEVPLSALELSFGYGLNATTSFTVSSALATATWPLIEGLSDLKGIGVTLTSRSGFSGGRYEESLGGDIHATLHLGQDFQIRLALRGQGAWALEVIPADGNVLPGLAALVGLVGGQKAQKEVDDALSWLGLGALAIDGVSIGFDLASRKVHQIAIDSHITLDGIRFDIVAYMPNFEFHGSLSPTTPIHLKKLLGTYFPGAEHFPEIAITQLDNAAIPSLKEYSLSAAITGDWQMDVGPVKLGFQQFSFEIMKQPAGVTGTIEGLFSLFDAHFEAIADHPEVGAGWQFTGRSLPGQALTIKAIHQQIAAAFKVDTTLPAAIEGLKLQNLAVWFDTASASFSFTCEALFPVHDQTLDITVTIRVEKLGDDYKKTFGGHITIAGLVFDLKFVQESASAIFVGAYYHTGAQQPLKVKELAAAVSSETARLVPDDLTIDLRDLIFVYSKGDPAGFLLGLELGAKMSLSDLPLVGKDLPADRELGIDSLRVLVASRAFTVNEVGSINALLPQAVPPIPDVSKEGAPALAANQGQPAAPPADAAALAGGVTVAARLLLGDGPARNLALPVAPPAGADGGAAPAVSGPSASSPAATASDTARWFDVQRALGPVYFERVGLQYQDKSARFLLDAALSLAGLTLALEGLSLGSPIDHFAPSFDLRGLGVNFKRGPLEIGGALLRTTVAPATGPAYDEYDGAALVKTEKLTLAALGSYAYLNGQPSLFIYGVLDQALGGPAFFFVTGLAAGFGYNRALVMPPIEQVATFPLITAAKSPQPITSTASPRDLLRTTLDGLRRSVPPAPESIFLAVGVKFTSFKIIDSFALLSASFGQRFELNLLGLSTLVAPTPEAGEAVTPLAEVELALKASFIPDEGFLGVSAQLTAASFLFSRNCHLTGGFAFYSWFANEHAGDFVLSVGGYHPLFRAPAHYPRVPRLGFNWQVDQQLVLKGDAYAALTPVALMAGGHLEAIWQRDNLRAAFNVGADFIVAWKPYHYDAHAYVDINVSYTFHFFGTHHINVDLGADLHIWGPEFAGTAHVKLSIISFDVVFGNQSQSPPQPIKWPAFRASFLPAADLCGVAVQGGLVRAGGDPKASLGTVDPQRLSLLASAFVPSTRARIRGELAIGQLAYTQDGDRIAFAPFSAADERATPAQAPTGKAKALGAVAVGPVGVKLPKPQADPRRVEPHLSSTLTISIAKGAAPMEHHFVFVPVLKNLPAAMWGELAEELRPDPNAEAMVRDTLAGFEIRPASSPLTGKDRATTGGTELLQYHLPPLPGGTYRITVTQDVASDELNPPSSASVIPPEQFKAARDFTVAGVRAALAPDEVYALYPPEGALGDYAADLPHIILNHSTLPWQESADPSRDDLPWLALLLFDEADLPAPRVVTVGQLRGTAPLPAELPPASFPPDSLGDSQPDEDKVTVIDLSRAQAQRLLPKQDAERPELALLAHVRRDASGAERAVIIGNRLPRAGAAHVAHLVSVRGRYGAGGFQLPADAGAERIRLVSLKSWRFTSTASPHNLAAALARVKARSGPLRLPAGPAERDAASPAARGYVPLSYAPAQGAAQAAWYHGPLIPEPRHDTYALPARSAAELMPEPAPGAARDLGGAAAWELGRLLALQSKPFAAALYRWKRARAQLRKQKADGLPQLPASVAAWLNDLALLRGVPFNYLVADEAMLPPESLRFFSVDRRWVACLVDGALSIGRVIPADFELDKTLAADLRQIAADTLSAWLLHVLDGASGAEWPALSGFLLRSDAAAGWPGLKIAASARGTLPAALVRRDDLSANTVLCLFTEDIAGVEIRQPEEIVHFGLGADAAAWQQSLVVEIATVAKKRIGAAAAAQAASATFAAHMLAQPSSVAISRDSPQPVLNKR